MTSPTGKRADDLTPLAKRLLEILRESEQGMRRREIAAELGRPGLLSPYDVQILEQLAADDLIEISKERTGPVREEYRYKAK